MTPRLFRRRERVPNGPPVRTLSCDKDCETRWDREPHHSEACEQRRRQASEHADELLRQVAREWREYDRWREAHRGL